MIEMIDIKPQQNMNLSHKVLPQHATEYILRLGDSALIQSQRISEWCGHAPSIEEDIALSNIALDYLGQSRYLLSLVGDEDQLAFLRDERGFRNFTLVELENGDFAQTVLKIFLLSSFQVILWQQLQTSSLTALAHIAEKAAKETQYHLEYSLTWLIKLGDGSEISHHKMQQAVDALMPYVAELFESDAIEISCQAEHIAPLSNTLKTEFFEYIAPIFKRATLNIPSETGFVSQGKLGFHSECLGKILAEMQFLQRSYPNGSW